MVVCPQCGNWLARPGTVLLVQACRRRAVPRARIGRTRDPLLPHFRAGTDAAADLEAGEQALGRDRPVSRAPTLEEKLGQDGGMRVAGLELPTSAGGELRASVFAHAYRDKGAPRI